MSSTIRPLKIKTSALNRLVKEVTYYEREQVQIETKLNALNDASDARVVRDQLAETLLACQDARNRATTAQTELARMIRELEPQAAELGDEGVEALANARTAYANSATIKLPIDSRIVSTPATAAPARTAPAAPATAAAVASPEECFIEPNDPMKQRTFVAVKPDGVQRKLIGEIIGRFESRGLKLVGLKLMQPTEAQAKQHYAEHANRPFFPSLVSFLTSGPIVAMAIEGPNAVNAVRAMCGATDPITASPGTIRGQFGLTVSRNIVHSSDSPTSGEREIGIWFQSHEVIEWTYHLAQQMYAL